MNLGLGVRYKALIFLLTLHVNKQERRELYDKCSKTLRTHVEDHRV